MSQNQEERFVMRIPKVFSWTKLHYAKRTILASFIKCRFAEVRNVLHLRHSAVKNIDQQKSLILSVNLSFLNHIEGSFELNLFSTSQISQITLLRYSQTHTKRFVANPIEALINSNNAVNIPNKTNTKNIYA